MPTARVASVLACIALVVNDPRNWQTADETSGHGAKRIAHPSAETVIPFARDTGKPRREFGIVYAVGAVELGCPAEVNDARDSHG